jgi:carboxyl-terminal processing protease
VNLLLTLLGGLGAVAAMAQTNVYSVNGGIGYVNVAVNSPKPGYDEVYQILRANLDGASPEQLDHAAALGLIHELAPRVSLAAADTATCDCDEAVESRVFDRSFGYIRIEEVASNLPAAFAAAFQQMTETNKTKLKGLVLDLRFAEGIDYAAAAKVADRFLNADRPLLDWQTGSARATAKADSITLPVAILVNSRTAGAAEAIAAVLRDGNVGLILGAQTAGQANVFKDFPLRDGQKLRVAVAPVKFGGDKTLSAGVAPDIAVNTSVKDELAYVDDPYKNLHPAPVSRNSLADSAAVEQPRMNEVELIREHRNGEDGSEAPVRDMIAPSAPSPVVADPVLARALDLLKGLAVVEPNRPG